MAGRYWKEASSVIIVGKSFSQQNQVNLMKIKSLKSADKRTELSRPRNSDDNVKSNIACNRGQCNYKVLTLRRSEASRFMPSGYVFPGGKIEGADASLDWLELFKSFGIEEDYFNDLICHNSTHTPIFTRNTGTNELMRSISLRISALRETFEECGLLICNNSLLHRQETNTLWASYLAGINLKEWQKAVRDDPSKFLDLCRHFKCYPDVWALKVWSNWLTPASMKMSRFDTAFFVAAFDQIPPVAADRLEAEKLQVQTHIN